MREMESAVLILMRQVCYDNVLCVNCGSGDYTCGDCPVGYEGVGVSCTDIDEASNISRQKWDLKSNFNII